MAKISSPQAVEEQFVVPSGLSVRGNRPFHDNGNRYLLQPFHHPRAWWTGWKLQRVRRGQFRLRELARMRRTNDYTFGALFLQKTTGG